MAKFQHALRAMFLVLFVLTGCSSPKGHEAPAAWNSLNAGMTRQEISALLGQPSSHLGPAEDIWRKSGWELQVTYDQNGRARDILRRPVGK
jgi:hypothetical protein